MAKSKAQYPKEYVCITRFTYWKGERIAKGQKIEVAKADMKNKGLKAKLASAFQPVVAIVSEPIKVLKKDKGDKIEE